MRNAFLKLTWWFIAFHQVLTTQASQCLSLMPKVTVNVQMLLHFLALENLNCSEATLMAAILEWR